MTTVDPTEGDIKEREEVEVTTRRVI